MSMHSIFLVTVLEALVDVVNLVVTEVFALDVFIGLLHVPNCAVGVAVVAFVVLATGEEVGGVFGVKIAATDLLMLLKGDLEAVSDQDHVRATGLFQIAVIVGESALVVVVGALDVIAVGTDIVSGIAVSYSSVVVSFFGRVEL